MRTRDQKISRDILLYGKQILHSRLFQQAALETHHLHSSISDHSLNVCITCVNIYYFLERLGIRINEADVVQAALCHDLGMIGREQKYATRRDAWKLHPMESARLARDIISDPDGTVAAIIESHMWPASDRLPASREGTVLGIADKYASIADWICALTKRTYKKKIKQEIL